MLRRTIDACGDFGEIAARQLWFRLSEEGRRRLAAVRPRQRAAPPPTLSCNRLEERLRRIVEPSDRLLMVHSSIDSLRLVDDEGHPLSGPRAALDLLRRLRGLMGDGGTLCMPTHPLYRADPGVLLDKSELVLRYSPRRTPSSVGLLTEFFRRGAGTLRSAHPLSALAAVGPRAEDLLRGNLNDRQPLPHGVDSGYHRFCRMDGLVLGIGAPLAEYLTLMHVPEEVQDGAWPVRDFFYRRRFLVELPEGGEREVVVRERRPEFVRALCQRRFRRDLLAEGLLNESVVDGVRIDSVRAGPFLEFMVDRQRRGPYPYVLPALARFGKPPRVSPSS